MRIVTVTDIVPANVIDDVITDFVELKMGNKEGGKTLFSSGTIFFGHGVKKDQQIE